MEKIYNTGTITDQETDYLNDLLSDIGISFRRVSDDSVQSMDILIDEEVFKQSLRRNAGRPYVILKQGDYLAHITKGQVKERMQTETAQEIADSLQISRRTLFRRLKEAQSDDDELL